MQFLSKFNEGICFLLCVIDIYMFIVNIHGLCNVIIKKGIPITNPFQKILDQSDHKLNKTWEDKGSEFYNRSIKS